MGYALPAPNGVGVFKVSTIKKVTFAPANLYWDGNEYHFETNQTDYPPMNDNNDDGYTYVAYHVGHFYWTNFTDYMSGTADYMPYAYSYSYSSQSTSDKFWCGEENPLTVDGVSGWYALTEGSNGEWDYLINTRDNASNLSKFGVTVTNNGVSYSNCIIIAPDDYSGTLISQSSSEYTLDDLNKAGIVCLPAAGYRRGSVINNLGDTGYYCSATPNSNNVNLVYHLNFKDGRISLSTNFRTNGLSLRLAQ